MHIKPCELGPISRVGQPNRPWYRARCACGKRGITGDDIPQLRARYAKHLTIAPPPAEILAKDAPTAADVRAYPEFFLAGPGHRIAEQTRCPHDYRLTSTCPGCDADQEAADAEAGR